MRDNGRPKSSLFFGEQQIGLTLQASFARTKFAVNQGKSSLPQQLVQNVERGEPSGDSETMTKSSGD